MEYITYFGVALVEFDSFGGVSDGIAVLLEFDIGLRILDVSEGGPRILRFWEK